MKNTLILFSYIFLLSCSANNSPEGSNRYTRGATSPKSGDGGGKSGGVRSGSGKNGSEVSGGGTEKPEEKKDEALGSQPITEVTEETKEELCLAPSLKLTDTSSSEHFYKKSDWSTYIDDYLSDLKESKRAIYKKNDILKADKIGDSWKLYFSNLPNDVSKVSIAWHFKSKLPFVTYKIESGEDLETQPFNFENIPIIEVSVYSGSGFDLTTTKYLIDLDEL